MDMYRRLTPNRFFGTLQFFPDKDGLRWRKGQVMDALCGYVSPPPRFMFATGTINHPPISRILPGFAIRYKSPSNLEEGVERSSLSMSLIERINLWDFHAKLLEKKDEASLQE